MSKKHKEELEQQLGKFYEVTFNYLLIDNIILEVSLVIISC